jgi:hypothetical protein
MKQIKMRNNYKTKFKKRSQEGLKSIINTLTEVIKDRAKFNTTREQKMLIYAQDLLNQFNNK